jgi:pimeloyl-ACP methyl ester carboxylesterase
VTGEFQQILRYAADLEKVSRRRFITGSVSAALLAADLGFTRHIQEQRKVMEILPVEDEWADAVFPATEWLLFPGYKTSWEEGKWIMNALQPTLHRRGRMAVVGYSNRGLDINEVVAAVRLHIYNEQLETLYFYGHSFGGMVAIEVASRLKQDGIDVGFVLLDCSPHSKFDVREQVMFEGVVHLYDAGYRVPSVLRGGYELGERIVHKDERSWRQIVDQTLAQISPLAPSSVLIQSQSSYIYHFDVTRFRDKLGEMPIAFIGNPKDRTVEYESARAGWAEAFPANLVSADRITVGALPAHASPQWNPLIYQDIIGDLQDQLFPLPGGGGNMQMY